jgi:hypothetical protein
MYLECPGSEEFLPAVSAQAELDAERAISFLASLRQILHEQGLSFEENEWHQGFSAQFLLGLGALLRLREWQDAGHVTPEMELPDAVPTLRRFLEDADLSFVGASIATLVIRVFHGHFVWSARAEVDAEIVVGFLDDQMADQIAELLWKYRHIA